jgi:Zn-dependent protease
MASLSPEIGKVAGIPIQLHWTFVVLLVLAFFLLFTSTSGIFIFVLIVLLFACVLLHELAHSITSKRNGIKVKRIVLLPIGGASIIDLDNVKPSVEFKISIAGPVASIVMGLGFGALVVYAPSGLLKEGIQFLFEINILLGVFNLLPGFPLDGGRVLRSYLQKKHSFLDSTKLAVRASNVVVVAIIVGTVAYAAVIPNATFVYREFIVLWDIIIALFLYDGAKAEMQVAYIKEYSSSIDIKKLITKNYIMIKKGTTVKNMYQMMIKKGTHIVLMKNGKELRALSNQPISNVSKNPKVSSSLAYDYFTTVVPTVGYNENLSKAIDIMRSENINIVAVTKGGSIAGILYGPHIESVISVYLSHLREKK